MVRTLATAGLMVVSLTACATVPMAPPSLDLLDYALDTAPETLKTRADARDGRAEYALSVVYEYGLHGERRDTGRAYSLKAKAVAQKGYTTLTQFIPGLDGKPGRTQILNLPRYDLYRYQTEANDRCAAALDNGAETPAQFDACQGEASFRDLKVRWLRAAHMSALRDDGK